MASQPVRVAIDLETTGLLADQDSIIEIGAVKFAGSEVLGTFERFVAPRQPLPYRIQRLTGIRPADLAGAPPLANVLPELRAFLGDCPLVGHSVPFDAAFLRHAGLVRHNPLIDTYELASALLPDLPSYSLESVGVALGIASPTYHRALADAVLARDVLLALLARLDEMDTTTLRMLSRLRVGGEWTPSVFVRTALRERGDHGTGTLGDQLGAKLGLDPAVLGLAVARAPSEPEPARMAAPAPSSSATAAKSGASATPAGERARALLTRCLEDGGTVLLEVPPSNAPRIDCLRALLGWATRTGGRALVVVADAAAVARTARADMPAALASLGQPPDAVRVAEQLESDAYLCLHRWFGAAIQPRDGVLVRELARGLAKLVVWSSSTLTGSRAEVALTGQELVAWERARAGREFEDSSEDCAYRKRGYCFVARAHAAARAAQVVVTSQAALAADLARQAPHLLAFSRVLVLDAHLLEDELRRMHSWSLDRRTLQMLLATLAESDGNGARAGLLHLCAQRVKDIPEASWFAQVARTRGAGDALFAALAQAQSAAQRGNREQREPRPDTPEQAVRLDARVRRAESWLAVMDAWDTLEKRLVGLERLVGEAGARAAQTGDGRRGAIAGDGVATDLLATRRTLEHLRTQVGGVMRAERPNFVAWLRTPYATPPRAGAAGVDASTAAPSASGESPALHIAPIEVGELLAPLQTSGHALALAGTALAVNGEFEFALGTLGLPDATPTHAATLDCRDQTLLLLPEDAVEPNAAAFQHQLDEALIELATRLGGRTVVIFPAHAALRATAAGIRRALEARDILLMAQGVDGSVRQLWQTFRTQARVVLLGAGAFWDGADVEGTTPACVVVARLPFPTLSDPLLAARADTWQDPQAQFVVPHAALRLRQALSGLAWSHSQRNAVVVFDRRVVSRGYGATVLGTLPHCAQRTLPAADMAEVVADWVDAATT